MIERAQHDAPVFARFLAYTSLCRPHVEYPPSVWGSSLDYLINDIEMVQHNAIRFIPALKGRDSVTAAHEKLKLDTLVDRQMKITHALLLRLLFCLP